MRIVDPVPVVLPQPNPTQSRSVRNVTNIMMQTRVWIILILKPRCGLTGTRKHLKWEDKVGALLSKAHLQLRRSGASKTSLIAEHMLQATVYQRRFVL